MPDSQQRKHSSARGTRPARAAKPAPAVERVADLAWAGRRAEAIALAAHALSTPGVAAGRRLELLELRAESLIALGELDRADDDAKAMLDLARGERCAAFTARAQNCRALVQMRKGTGSAAIATATSALRAARRSRERALEATSLLRLAEAQFRDDRSEPAAANATRAAGLFAALRQPAGQGRALWALSAAQSALGHAADARRAAADALALCRSCGDLYGAGNALNMPMFDEPDLGARLKLLNQALAAFEASGHLERQGVVTFNLGIAYGNLGLHRRARRLYHKAADVQERTGSRAGSGALLLTLAFGEIEMGHLDAARRHLAAADAIADEPARDRHHPYFAAMACGRLAILDGDPRAALRHIRRALKLARDAGLVALEIAALAELAHGQLAAGNPAAALTASRRATRIHRDHDLAALQAMSPPLVWWRHSQALQANGDAAAAREALEMAYRFLQDGVRGLGDEGLRRNYLNKIGAHREIVRAWIGDARRRRLTPARRGAHLAGETSLREPFERLVDTGLRLNELRSAAELHEFLIDEATELSGAERVLLVLETPDGLRLAGSLVPRGEDAEALLRAVAPILADVRRARAVTLSHSPEGANELDQRSRVVAPLIAQRDLLGYLYADLDGAFGRLRAADRDLLGLLASQAAVALANAQWSQGLENEVAWRTEELRESHAALEQRANELAIINSIQQGMAGSLDFQAIVELVGDKLREVLGVLDIGVVWLDLQERRLHFLYRYEHGERLHLPPMPIPPAVERLIASRASLLCRTAEEQIAAGIGAVPGTDQSRSAVVVPIVGRDRALGFLSMEDYQRDGAYGDAELRLLETVAAGMGVALENARLFDEAQEALAGQSATAEILRVISRSPTDVQPVFDAIVVTALELLSCDITIVLRREGDSYHPVAGTSRGGIPFDIGSSRTSIDPGVNFPSRVFVDKTLLHLPDWSAIDLPEHERRVRRHLGISASLLLPLLSDGECIAVLVFARMAPGAFDEAQIAMAKSFADQALIAIENVRLFNETSEALAKVEERERALTESLGYQTAISHVLRCISESPTDVAPVFDAILESAARLFGSPLAAVLRYDGELVHLVATHNWTPEAIADARRLYPAPPNPQMISGRVVLSGRVQTVRGHAARHRIRPGLGPARPLAAHARRTAAQGRASRRRDHRRLARPRHDAAAADRSAADLRRPGRDRDPERAPVQGGAGGARRRRGGQRGQERVPGHDEPRDPHADERGDRHERAAARHAAGRRAARLRRHHPRLGRRAADDHQRHPRLLQDRGRAHGPRGAALRPARVRGVRTRSGHHPRRREAPGHRVRVRRRGAGGDRRRRDPAAPDPAQPARQRRQVHRARRGRGHRDVGPGLGRRRRAARSRCATPASG